MQPSIFLEHLKDAASSPFAFVAYVCVVAAWLYAATSRHRLNVMAKMIKDLPEHERIKVIEREYGTTPRAGLSAEQWIRARLHALLFLAFLSLLIAAIAVAGIAAVRNPNEEIPPLEEPHDVTNVSSAPSPLLKAKIKSINAIPVPVLVAAMQQAVSPKASSRIGSSDDSAKVKALSDDVKSPANHGLELVQILEEGANRREERRIFDITLANKSPKQRLLTRFDVSWSYFSAGGAGGPEAHVLKPVGKYAVELPIEVDHPYGSKLQPLSPPIVVPPGSEKEPNLVTLRLHLSYRLVDRRSHPFTGWDIKFNLKIVDSTGERTMIFSERSWHDRPYSR